MLASFLVAVCLFASAGVASAQSDPYTTPPPRGPSVDVPASEVVFTPRSPAVRTQAVRSQPVQRGGSLPVTGGDVIGLVVLGGGAVALGGVLLASRRRPALR